MMAQKSEPSCTQTGNDRTQSGNVVDVVAAAIGRAIEEMGDEFDANRHECLKTWTDFEVAQAINGPNYTLVPRDFYERLAAAALEAMADCSRPANKGEIRTSAAESRQSGAIGGPTIPPGWRITGPDACPACRGTGRSEPLPDFEGDDPKTMTVCTVSLCQLCGGSGRDPNWRPSAEDKIVTTDKGSINLTVLKDAMVRLSEKGPTICVEKGGGGETVARGVAADSDSIEDGFGNAWSSVCPQCGRRSMQVVRPGKAQCGYCG